MRNRRDSTTHYATPALIWDESELAELPPLPRDLHGCVSKGARRDVGEQDRRAVQERVVALRAEGKTWPEIAAAVGLSHSRVRAIYEDCTAAQGRPDDDMILENVRAFLATGSAPSRRTYGSWPARIVSPATVENRFGSWAKAVMLAGGTAALSRGVANACRGPQCEGCAPGEGGRCGQIGRRSRRPGWTLLVAFVHRGRASPCTRRRYGCRRTQTGTLLPQLSSWRRVPPPAMMKLLAPTLAAPCQRGGLRPQEGTTRRHVYPVFQSGDRSGHPA